MPIEFTQYPSPENTGVSGDTLFRLTVAYDGTGRRISKTRWVKAQGDAGWSRGHVTHYTGIGTEVRENFAELAKETKVVVNMPVFFRVTLTRLKPRSYIEAEAAKLHRKRHPSAIKWRSHSPEAKLRSLKTGPRPLRHRGRRPRDGKRFRADVRMVPEEPPRKHHARVRHRRRHARRAEGRLRLPQFWRTDRAYIAVNGQGDGELHRQGEG